MEIIFYSSIGLAAIAATAVVLIVRKHNRMFNDNEDPVPCDDLPGHYEDYELSERPYIEII